MDSERPELKKTFSSHTNVIHTVCFSPDQTKLCSCGDDSRVILTSLQNNQTEKVPTGRVGRIYGSDISHDGKILSIGCTDKTVRIWKVSEKSERVNPTILKGHDWEVTCVRCYRNDSNHVVSGSYDETIRKWNIERKKNISTLQCKGYVYSVDILPGNQTLASTCGRNLKFWDLRSGNCVRRIFPKYQDSTGHVNSIQFHPNSFLLATGSSDNSVKIYDFRKFKLLQDYKDCHTWNVYSVCFHPSGKYLVSCSRDKTIRIFDLSEKKVLFTLNGHSDTVHCVQFSPDGTLFASGSWDMKVILWNFPLGRRMIRDIDEEERVKYLVNLYLNEDFGEQNVLKIRIEDFCSLFSFKFFFMMNKTTNEKIKV